MKPVPSLAPSQGQLRSPRKSRRYSEALCYEVFAAFNKHCTDYRIARHGRDILATAVTGLQVEGTFIEVEALVASRAEFAPGFSAV